MPAASNETPGTGRGLGPKPPPTARRGTDDFAVVIGIDEYANLESLKGAVNDANAFYGWLCEKHGGGLERDNAKLILVHTARATLHQSEIDLELDSVLTEAEKRGGGRRLYFYFGGHGSERALFLPSWSTHWVRVALSIEEYLKALCDPGLFEEVAIFVDSCQSRAPMASGSQPLFDGSRELPNPHPTRRFVALASEAGQPAFESAASGACRGIFTKCLLSILNQSADSGIHAHRLKVRLEEEVEKCAQQQRAHVINGFREDSRFGRGRPAPRGGLPLDGLADLVRLPWLPSWFPLDRIALLERSFKLELRFATRRGEVELLNSELAIVAVHTASDEPWSLRLRRGLYYIRGGGAPSVPFEHDGIKEHHDV